jgi:hypothetical protein
MSDTELTLIKTLMSAVPDRSTIFHYTSQQGLLGIIKEKALWLSSIRHLSDAAEFGYSVELVRDKLMRKLRAERGPWNDYYGTILGRLDAVKYAAPFVGSFSEHGDLLSQWRAYTPNGIGFSVGFEYEYLIGLAQKQQCRIVKCAYQESEHDAIVEELINLGGRLVNGGECEDAVTTFFLGFYSIAPALKHPSFAEEREWRVVKEVALPNDVARKFRQGKSMLIPYTEFNLAKEDGRVSFSRVFVGPTPHMELSMSSLENLLMISELDGWRITASSVPYRSW